MDDKNKPILSSYYPNLSNSKPKSDQIITNSYSPQRSSTKPESRNSNISYGLRNPYDFQNDEPVTIRHEHKATPFRTTNVSSGETFSTNTNRYTKQPELPTTIRNVVNSENDLNEIRSRIFSNEQKDSTTKKAVINNESDLKKSTNNEKLDVANKSKYYFTVFPYYKISFYLGGGGTFLYAGITIVVALIVFVLYLWLEK